MKIRLTRILKFNRTALAKLTIFMVVIIPSFICATPLGTAASSEYREAPEYLIKAAYLHKFLFFVQWPDLKKQSDKTITIGILGQNPFGPYLKKLKGQVIKSLNKRIAIKYFGPYTENTDLRKCQLVFISASEKNNVKNILNCIKGTAVLTVSDMESFLKQGGMIKLIKIKDSIRWNINRTPIKRSGLKVSSTLLQSAVDVVHIPKLKDK